MPGLEEAGKAGTIWWVLGPRHRGLSGNDWYLYGTYAVPFNLFAQLCGKGLLYACQPRTLAPVGVCPASRWDLSASLFLLST